MAWVRLAMAGLASWLIDKSVRPDSCPGLSGRASAVPS